LSGNKKHTPPQQYASADVRILANRKLGKQILKTKKEIWGKLFKFFLRTRSEQTPKADLTLAPNFSASVTTNTSSHRGSTRVMVFLQWNIKTFTVKSRILR
jgi:hypothetical protein